MPRLLAVALGVCAVASILFVFQGGFGAGHEPFDLMIFILGLPWTLILLVLPNSEALWLSDYVMLVLLPLGCNLLVIVVARRIVRRE
jgi:hypothetical protein